MKIVRLEDAISEAKRLAEEKLAVGESPDEFVEIGEADGFKLYITAGKTVKDEFPFLFMKTKETFSCWFLKEKSNSDSKKEKKQ
jgi:hypothetical protein